MNLPVGVTAWYDGTNSYISGVLDTEHPETTKVDIYVNQTAPQNGFGQGEFYVGTATPKETGAFHLTVPEKLGYPFLSATVTSGGGLGSTSEFSPCYGDPITPGVVDSDGDGLPDDWELNGVDFNGDAIIDLDLRKDFGASWGRKDVFVEFDYMPPSNAAAIPTDATINLVKAAFNKAPVLNVNGTTGIALHVNKVSQADAIPRVNPIWFGKYVPDANNAVNDFGDLKDRRRLRKLQAELPELDELLVPGSQKLQLPPTGLLAA